MRWVLLLVSLFAFSTLAKTPTIDDFARPDKAQSIKISPEGDYLAMEVIIKGKKQVVVLRRKDFKPTTSIHFGERAEVGDYYWASNERLVVTKVYKKGWTEEPLYYGEMMSINYDGSKGAYIFGHNMAGGTGTNLKRHGTPLRAWGYMIDPLPEDEKYILISSVPMDNKGDKKATVFKLNVFNGKRKKVAFSPVSYAQFMSDQNGEVRFVIGEDKNGKLAMHYREKRGDDWKLFYTEDESDGKVIPVSFASDDEVYILDNTEASTYGLMKMNLKTGAKKLIYRDKVVDPHNMWFSADGRSLYALEVEPDYPSYVFVDPKAKESANLKGLLQAFPGHQVALASQTLDGDLSVVYAYSDINPGSYYLYDAKAQQVSKLLGSRDWVDPKQSATVEAIQFKARDGMTIYGYLTVPAGKEMKDLPLLVNPHGGPHGPRDYWQYDRETQMFASQGVAVLQVNFRGSGGYGREFEEAGYRNWGSKIQYDIIDATRHLIDKGIADKDNICIYGGSFGGYSALQSSILAPDLYKCAIGFAGVYDLELMYDVGDIPTRRSGREYLKTVIGEDNANMKAFSPVYNIDKLKAPVMLIHGGKDERVPIEHAEDLRKALNQNDHPYEWIELDKEGHGFFNSENRAEVYKNMVSFLEKHLNL